MDAVVPRLPLSGELDFGKAEILRGSTASDVARETISPSVSCADSSLVRGSQRIRSSLLTVKKLIALILILCLTVPAALAAEWEWVEEPVPVDVPILSGVKIGIDPGHQAKANSEREPVAPGSSEKKAKVASGTSGIATKTPEYVRDLEISLKLRDALEAAGAEVYMTRETNEVNISNMERALMMNDLGVDLVLRIHCNGSTDKSVHGTGLYITKTGDIAAESLVAAEALLPAMIAATGARRCGIFKRDTYTGMNWSTVPCILVEMGYMTNYDEDLRLADPDYQQKLVDGMVQGIIDYINIRDAQDIAE